MKNELNQSEIIAAEMDFYFAAMAPTMEERIREQDEWFAALQSQGLIFSEKPVSAGVGSYKEEMYEIFQPYLSYRQAA